MTCLCCFNGKLVRLFSDLRTKATKQIIAVLKTITHLVIKS